MDESQKTSHWLQKREKIEKQKKKQSPRHQALEGNPGGQKEDLIPGRIPEGGDLG